jgi:cytochrome oxidase assembly protein ShyY1
VKIGSALYYVAVVLVTAACVGLGIWQLGRLREKQAINAARRSLLAAAPLEAGGTAPPAAAVRGRRVRLRGRFDERFEVLLRGREREGSPGVEVVTPFRLAADSAAVLVDRGWIAADDGATLPAGAPPPDTAHSVTGWVDDRAPIHPIIGLRPLTADSVTTWSAVAASPDSVRALLPYALAPYILNRLADPGTRTTLAPVAPEPLNESMHLGYALQWFLIGALVFAGSLQLARSRGRIGGPH